MKIDLSKSSHVLFFVVFLPILSLGIGWALATFLPDTPFWVETLSPLSAYGFLYAFFNRRAWRWPLFRWLGIVEAPDLRGRWVGEQLSTHKKADGKPTSSHVVIEIRQTFSDLKLRAYYKRWNNNRSDSCFMDIDGELYLVTLFESEPNPQHPGDEKIHQGTRRLQYIRDTGQLVGDYFNSNGNKGELRLKRTSFSLEHSFKP